MFSSRLGLEKAYVEQKRPHIHWKKVYRSGYLDEFLRWEGRGDFRRVDECPDCIAKGSSAVAAAKFRCLDCFTPDLVCEPCCVRRHRQLPFHIIEVCPVASLFWYPSIEAFFIAVDWGLLCEDLAQVPRSSNAAQSQQHALSKP